MHFYSMMLARRSSTGNSGRIKKPKHHRNVNTKKTRGTPQIRVTLKLFSPTKAARWDPHLASTSTSSNYNLKMATEHDIDVDRRQEILMDQREDLGLSDADSENEVSDLEGYISDWEKYVDPYADWKWLERIDGEVTLQRDHRSPKIRVAKCNATLVRRSWIANTFWDDMEEPEDETADLAFELFDRYGCLQGKFKNHPIKRGSGVWNDELDCGDILMINDIHVSRSNRRKGVGSKLVHAILDLVGKKSREFFALTSPEYMLNTFEREDSPNDTDSELLIQTALRFWRNLGFRRIGSSRWLGHTQDLNHPSHAIAPEEDFDFPSNENASFTQEMACLAEAIPTIDDTGCLTQLKNIFEGVSLDDTRWEARDHNGNTILHLISCSFMRQSTAWLMHENPYLCSALNATGSTPLDLLEEAMDEERGVLHFREKRTDLSDRFAGFHPDITSCYALLKGLNPEELSEAEMSRLKFGCTCGNRIGGFLSPRTRDILLMAAEITYDFMFQSSNVEDAKLWCEENEDMFRYLPNHILQSFQVNAGMVIGFCKMWNHLASCLRNRLLPTEENILLLIRNGKEWPPHCRNFLQNGGTVSSVATMLFSKAMNLKEYHKMTQAEFPGLEWNSLPRCRNDREFGLVSGMCGYERVSRVQLVDMRGKRIRY